MVQAWTILGIRRPDNTVPLCRSMRWKVKRKVIGVTMEEEHEKEEKEVVEEVKEEESIQRCLQALVRIAGVTTKNGEVLRLPLDWEHREVP